MELNIDVLFTIWQYPNITLINLTFSPVWLSGMSKEMTYVVLH